MRFPIIFLTALLVQTHSTAIAGPDQPVKSGTAYYIDSRTGKDGNKGTSVKQAWRTLDRVKNLRLQPGDSIRFARGSNYTGPLYIINSGQIDRYLVITDYGDTLAPAPSFTNPVFKQDNYGNCIRVKGSYVLIENLYFHQGPAYIRGPYTPASGWDTTVWEMGAIYIDKGAEHCIVRRNEIEDCVVGIKSYGRFARIEHNYIHDCNRVLKEWGWGPLGIWFGADYQEAAYNRIINYRAEDPRISWGSGVGGGADGGAFEIDDARYDKRHISIHHNYTRDCQGFLEVTWTDIRQHPDYSGFYIHHNVSDDYQQFTAIWNGKDCLIEHNTIIRRKKNVNDWGVFNITQTNSRNRIRKNIVVTEKNIPIFNTGLRREMKPDNIISDNLYFAASGELVMGKEGPGERPVYGDPLFVNYEGVSTADFSVLGKSPAIIQTIGAPIGASDDNPKPPHIVIIMADDLGYGDFGCYGASKLSTPAVDAIAAAGKRFTDAHTASSLCSPSRYSMMTGRYSWRTPLRAGVLTWFAQPLIEKGRTTLASLLKKNGYRTACIGKWHLGFDWGIKNSTHKDTITKTFSSWDLSTQDHIDFSKPVREGPISRGFDYYYGISASNNMIPFVYIENDRVIAPPTVQKDYAFDTDQLTLRAVNWDLETIDQDLTKRAVGFIDGHFKHGNGQPLFLYFPTSAIHRPCLPKNTRGQSQAGLRGDMIMEFDRVVRDVVEALKRNKALENTLLIITSDNGGVPGDPLLPLERYRSDLAENYNVDLENYQPQYINKSGNAIAKKGWITYDHASSGPFLGFKSDAWEGGHRVPLIIQWPGKIKAGSVDSSLVCNSDMLATFSELLHSPLAENEGEDSYSYLGNLLDKTAIPTRRSMTIVSGGGGAFVVRKGDWKYIEPGRPAWGQTFYPNGPKTSDYQLYNLRLDPGEQYNRFHQEPTLVAELQAVIRNTKSRQQAESTKFDTVTSSN